MDQQRIQAYVNLIKQLFNCTSGEEIAVVLQQHAELVDAELLVVMRQYATYLDNQGNGNAARWLLEMAEQLTEALGITNAGVNELPEDSEQFLLAVLQLVADSRGDAQQVYPFLAQHQDSLNEQLLQTLPEVAARFLRGESDQQNFVADVLVIFGNLIAQFPLGQPWLNLELAIAAYERALEVYTREAFPQDWATTQNNLAIAYCERIRGERADNLELAIAAYERALEVYTREAFPQQWATTQNNLALAYCERIRGERADNLELAIAAYERALEVYTREAFPQDWAMTQNNLANAYLNRIRGERADNLELAIAAYERALEVYTREAFPHNWAATQNNLASAYRNRIRGERADNLELAIAAYQRALEVRTREALPQDWAMTQNNLANAYSERIRGERADNLELAITAYERALEVYTREAFPQNWAMTQNNLASAYRNRICGERADNLELAITTAERALEVYTREAFPQDWAGTQNNLALAYRNRIRGERADNLELAIAAYERALEVRTREAFPQDWAGTQNNLAIAYSDRIRGERADNLELAIAAYERALEVRTRDAFPQDWAATQNNLASAYRDRIRGERADNLELAIAAYERALEVRTRDAFPQDWAMTQNNLASAYYYRIRGERADNLELAIAAYEHALEVYTREAFPQDWAMTQNNLAIAYSNRIRRERADNLELAIAACERALEVSTREAFPQQWAMTQNNLASAYYYRICGERADNLELAIAACERALEVSTREAFPLDCLRTARNLANLHFDQQTWAKAAIAYTQALEAGEILYQSAILLDGKAAELAEINNLPRRAAYALARSGDLQGAVVSLERGRARGLSDTLDRDRADLTALQQVAPSLYTEYTAITTQLRDFETQQRLWMTSTDRHCLTPSALSTQALQLRNTLTEIIAQIRQVPNYQDFLAQPNFNDICQALRPGIPIVYLVPTSAGSLALIVTQESITPLWLDDLTEESLRELLVNWFNAYELSQINPQAWLDAIDQGTHQLWQPLMSPLIDYLQQHHFQQATLIPTGFLNLLPLHAAWVEDSTTPTGRYYALDAINFTYVPNARSLSTARNIAQRTLVDSLLAIDNPRHDLPNSTREVTAAIATFTQHQVLKHEQATISAVLAALPHYNILHLSCHGTANLSEPLTSGLVMSDGLLTLRDLLDLKLDGIRLAILSACETGLAGTELADEAISLPTGLLQAGVAGVAASLWSVSDLSTMMLLTRFYEFWRIEHLEIDQALRQAQLWMRDSTNSEKVDYFKASLPEFTQAKMPADTASFLYQSVILSKPNARDFAHPFHWAAFQYVGV
jgi:CHAT domain-containing protein/predicted LPLAT superfamily acyltransferase